MTSLTAPPIHRWRAFSLLAVAAFMTVMDLTIVNTALPSIERDLHFSRTSLLWVVTAYELAYGGFLLLGGRTADLLGRRRILSLGLAGFGVASLLCALSPSIGTLIAFRALQGIAGALLVPSSLALIISSISGPAQGKAIGSWTAWTGISFIIGPLVGGFLVDQVSWRWIFAINALPIVLTMFLLRGIAIVKDDRQKTSVDYLGSILCAFGLAGPVFALIEQPRYGWDSPLIYLPLAIGIALFAVFLIYEKTALQPMLPLGLFRNHNFSIGNVATLAIYAGLSASTFFLVVFLQQVAGYSALAAGLAGLPITIIMFVLSPRMGALAAKYGPRLFMGFGPIIGALGFVLLTRMNAQAPYWSQVFPGIIIFGIGLSTTVAPLTAAILGDVAPNQAGIASAVNNAVARIAGLVAVAAVGAIVAAQFSHIVDHKMASTNVAPSAVNIARQISLEVKPPAPYQHNMIFKSALTEASVSAFHAGLLTVAALLAAGGAISLVGIRNPAKL